MRVSLFLVSVFSITLVSMGYASNEKPVYKIYDKEGKPVKYGKVVKNLEKQQVILFGEYHNNAVVHWLQFEFLSDLSKNTEKRIVLGAEMFEADVQHVIDEYFNGWITEDHFEQSTRVWKNYSTDYKPIVQFAKNNNISLIATNIPRRYASLVARKGQEILLDLPEETRNWMVSLPFEVDYSLPGYKAMKEMMPSHGSNFTSENMIEAQAIKDATMAHFIIGQLSQDVLVYHIHGTYHSDHYEGIYWYLRQSDNSMRIATIAAAEQDDLGSLDEKHLGKADFIIVVKSNFTKTH
ncbi:MAG: ChaN family lipoprotein [Cyclobacteriaceae bacterium]|nr:ChaN family lipoprotein [Cyclobacteriaceae bacterium]